MKIYIASALYNLMAARAWADILRADGLEVCSTWHEFDACTVEREDTLSHREQFAIAKGCLAEVAACDVLVWLHGNAKGRVGAAVEVGAALSQSTPVYTYSVDGTPAPSVFGALCDPVCCVHDLIARLK